MAILQKTREGIGRYLMQQKAKHLDRHKQLKHLHECRSALLLSSLSDDAQAIHALAFADYLRNQGADVFHLIYNPDQKKGFQTHINDIELITRNNLNFLFTPNQSGIQSLLDREFDLMADLTRSYAFPLEYCATVSKARLKTGASGGYRSRVCDITIDISGKPEVGFLIGQMKHYLTIFNSKAHVA